nr:MAG TPA: hypothetical protein [Caudoviricetes sp.]
MCVYFPFLMIQIIMKNICEILCGVEEYPEYLWNTSHICYKSRRDFDFLTLKSCSIDHFPYKHIFHNPFICVGLLNERAILKECYGGCIVHTIYLIGYNQSA